MLASSLAALDVLRHLGGFGVPASLNQWMGVWSHDLSIQEQSADRDPHCSTCADVRPATPRSPVSTDPHTPDCVFCRIVAGQAPAHRIWEDADHLAFLSIFPNTEGFSVVIPKAHRPSYVVEMEQQEYTALHLAARQVAHLLDQAFEDVARTGIMYEGYGVDHAHAKLFPMHHTAGNQGENWREVASPITGYFDHYQGYLSSHDHVRADDAWLARVAERVRAVAE